MKSIGVVFVLCLAFMAATAEGAGHDPGYAVECFPAAQWGPAPDTERPCTIVNRPAEDGSVRVIQATASQRLGVCILPNPAEESGSYVARCQRVAGQGAS
jgi:hypothetical protein